MKALAMEKKLANICATHAIKAAELNNQPNIVSDESFASSQSSIRSGYTSDDIFADFVVDWKPTKKRARKDIDYYKETHKTLSVHDQSSLEKNIVTDWTKALSNAGKH